MINRIFKRQTISIWALAGALGLAGQAAWAQEASVRFSNLGGEVDAPVTLRSTGEPLGEEWVAQLWAGTSETDLAAANDPVAFAGQGYFSGGTVSFQGVAPGTVMWFQVAAWDGSAASLNGAQSGGLAWGRSNLFSLETGGGGNPPLPPPNLIGMKPFAVGKELSPEIAGRIWQDLDQDGLQDEAEPAREGVLVELLDCESNQVLASQTADAEGRYRFENIGDATVYLQFSAPEDFAPTRIAVGEDAALDSDADPLTGRTRCIELTCDGARELCVQENWDLGLASIGSAPQDPEPGEGGGTPAPVLGVSGAGFWKNHPAAWPVEEITVGGVTYHKSEAAAKITNGADKTRTLFRALVSAKLNVAGGNDDSCVAEAIAQADAWLEANPLGSGVRGGNPAWREEGQALAGRLEDYNEGRLCADKAEERREPIEVAVGFNRPQKGKPTEFRVRMKGQAGRTYLLQKSSDLETWTDVREFSSNFGVTETVLSEIENEPNSYFRVVVAPGPADVRPKGAEDFGVFRQVGSGEDVELEPIVYNGDLVVAGADNRVSGTHLDENRHTVVAGDLDVRGSRNQVSNLTVLGKVILRGNFNTLESVDYQGGVEVKGGPNNAF